MLFLDPSLPIFFTDTWSDFSNIVCQLLSLCVSDVSWHVRLCPKGI